MNIGILTKLFPSADNPYFGIFTKVFWDFFCSHYQDISVDVVRPLPIPLNIRIKKKGIIPSLSFHPKKVQKKYTIHYPRIFSFGTYLEKYHHVLYYSRIRKYFRTLKQKPDILHAYWIYPDCYVGVKIAKEMNIPAIVHFLGSDVNELLFKKELKQYNDFTMNHADTIIVCSNDMKQKILGIYPDVENKIAIVYNAVNINEYSGISYEKALEETKLTEPNRKKRIVFVGRVVKEKGVGELLEAVAALSKKRDDFELYIIGVTPDETLLQQYKNVIKSNNLENIVTIVGKVPKVAYWYRIADLMVLPSYSEGLPLTVVESLACGTPVVATDVGGIPDILNDETLGTLIPKQNIEALESAINRMLDKTYNRQTIINTIDSFSLQNQSDKLMSIYKKLISH